MILTVIAVVLCTAATQYVNGFARRMADPEWRTVWGQFNFLWIVNQLPCFLFGILVARWIDEGGPIIWPAALVLVPAGLMIWVTLYPDSIPLLGKLTRPAQIGALFAIFALGLSQWQPRVLVNPVICWIGKISYSAYLVHLLIVSSHLPFPRENYPLAFASLASITIAISSFTFLCIEKPFIRIGHAFAKAMEMRRMKNAVV